MVSRKMDRLMASSVTLEEKETPIISDGYSERWKALHELLGANPATTPASGGIDIGVGDSTLQIS